MSLEFDCDQLFEYFKNNCGTRLTIDHQSPSTIVQSGSTNEQNYQDANIENYFSFQELQPKENNHVWLDHDLQHMAQKDPMNRKQTFAGEEELNEYQNASQNIFKCGKVNKNQTKNIPKNFGKAIMAFIQKEKKHVKLILQKTKEGSFKDFLQSIKIRRKQINTIADLRQMWVSHPFSKCLRMMSYQFLRKHSLRYIFNSRVHIYGCHIKYRQRLLQAIKKPCEFLHIKEY